MSAGLRLELRQTQQLVMTPQLQQAIRLLAMSHDELTEFVAAEIEKNPILEVGAEEERPAPSAPDDALATGGGTPAPADAAAGTFATEREVFDTGTENLHDSSPSDGPAGLYSGARSGPVPTAGRPDGASLPDLGERLARETTLREHLLAQLGQMPGAALPAGAVARCLVDELDDHGFLPTDGAEVAMRLGIGSDLLETAIGRLQRCEPTGVGARSLAECLALQLSERDRLDPAMQALLDNLELVATGDTRRLRGACGVDAEDLADMLTELRCLDPRPCASFSYREPETLIPDILLKRSTLGGWEVELNADALPRVLVDRSYQARIGGARDDETRAFLRACQADATWLVKSLDQRARTILVVATEIVRRQERFFDEGIAGLQPMTLKLVAESTGLHESTVSRVTSNKYIATERGIFELKFFFTNAVGGGEGDVSSTTVRHRIRALVDAEADGAVLSDDAIVDLLKADGIDIARRTVAKYRKSLRIPSSVERRRQNSMNAGARQDR